MKPQVENLLQVLSSHANPKNVEGMARFGITSTGNILGLSTPFLFSLKKKIGRDHQLALDLWNTGIFEARILGALIADPKQLTKAVAQRWVRDFDNWAICDGVCLHCFRYTPYAHNLIPLWIRKKDEFIRRAGFTMMATLSVADKKSPDRVFLNYLPFIQQYATDERNYVKKAVNWALRQVGKRSLALNRSAIVTAKEIRKMDSPAAKWIAADALRELQSEAVQQRLRKKAQASNRKK